MFDVAVVGFGPVGAVAANLLGLACVKTVVIEKTDQVFGKPRAIAFDHEVMRVFQNIGIAEEIQKHMGPYVPTDFIGADGRPIAHFVSKPGPAKLGWQPNYVFNQPAVESAIRAKAARAGVTFCLQHEVTGLDESPEGSVSLTIRKQDGSEQVIQARYVIGCDGSNSVVRHALGIPLTDMDFDRPFLVVDATVHEPALSRLPSVNVQDCNPERPSTYIVGPGAHRRWEIMLLPGETQEDTNRPDRIAKLLSKWIAPADATIVRAATYYFHARYAETMRVGRVFLAGDAAHQTPPFMGQGMAQGIRDAANLVWKLKSVLWSSSDESLLDTYQKERLPHVIKTTQRAVGLGNVICELDPQKAAERDKNMRLANGDPPRKQFRQDLIPPLDSGFATPAKPGLSGELAPQPSVISDSPLAYLDDITGTGFRIIADDEFARTIGPEQLNAIQRFGITLYGISSSSLPRDRGSARIIHERDGLMTEWLRQSDCRAVVVRPDHYVYAAISEWLELEPALSQLSEAMGLKSTVDATI